MFAYRLLRDVFKLFAAMGRPCVPRTKSRRRRRRF